MAGGGTPLGWEREASCSGWVRSEWEKWSGEKEIRPLDHACEEEVVQSHDCACPEQHV